MDDTAQQGDPDEETVELRPPTSRRRARQDRAVGRTGWWVLGGAVLCTAALLAVLVGGLDRGDEPRELQVDVPEEVAGSTAEPQDAAADDDEVLQLVRDVMTPTLSIEERSRRVEPAPAGRPAVEAIIASFDGLAESNLADIGAATMAVTRPTAGVALVSADVPLGRNGRARLLDLMVRHDDDGWVVTYETVCGLATLLPMGGGDASCAADPRAHRIDGPADLATVLTESHPDGSGAPLLAVADPYQSVRTGDRLWLVDYPEEELGGGAPQGPAELVRVDARTGAETGRIPLGSTGAQLAAEGERLWVLTRMLGDGGTQLGSTLVTVDGDDLHTTPGPDVAGEWWTIAAAKGSVWLGDGSTLQRIDTREWAVARSWTAEELGLPPYWNNDPPTATPAGLWIPGRSVAGPGSSATALLVPADGTAPRQLGTSGHGPLAAAGDGVWAASWDGTTLERLGADGSVEASAAVPMLPAGERMLSSDGHGGVWILGPAVPADDTYSNALTFHVTSRPTAVHLDADGEVIETWWGTGAAASNGDRLVGLGNGLGRFEYGGLRHLAE